MATAQPRQILVTRPAAESRDTAERLRALGWEPLVAPVLQIDAWPLRADPAWRPQAVLVTSGNALASLPPDWHGVPVLAVGDATAARARAAGFRCVDSAGRDAAALHALVAARCRPASGPLLLPTGAGQGQELAQALRQAGFRVARRVVYVARPLSALPRPALSALVAGEVAAALFFSAASARAFAGAVRRPRAMAALRAVRAVAISAATADALSLLPWRDIRVASSPNQDELLACLK